MIVVPEGRNEERWCKLLGAGVLKRGGLAWCKWHSRCGCLRVSGHRAISRSYGEKFSHVHVTMSHVCILYEVAPVIWPLLVTKLGTNRPLERYGMFALVATDQISGSALSVFL